MTDIAESNVCMTRNSAIAAWSWAWFARRRERRCRRLARIELERWSRHLLKDVGLAE